MRNRVLVAATLLLACAFALSAQQSMYKIKLNPSGSMIALDKPVLMNGKYVFHAWPHGEQTALRQAMVLSVAPLTGPQRTIYQVDLAPSGKLYAKDDPTLKGNTYVFHMLRDGTLMSLRQSDVKRVTALTGEAAFWAEQGMEGEALVGDLAIQGGGQVIVIGTPPVNNSSQAGASNLNSVGGSGSGISGAPRATGRTRNPGHCRCVGPGQRDHERRRSDDAGRDERKRPPTQPQ